MKFLIFFAILVACLSQDDVLTHCKFKGKEYANGETWIAETNGVKFKAQCKITGNMYINDIIACVTKFGDEIQLGETKAIGEYIYMCKKKGRTLTRMEAYLSANASCIQGQKHGEEWTTPDGFVIICGNRGREVLKGCMVDGTFYPRDIPFTRWPSFELLKK